MLSPLMFQIELSTPEGFSQQFSDVLSRLASDFVGVLLERHLADALKGPLIPAPGAGYDVIGFELDPIVFNQKVRAALRATGLDLDRRFSGHNESSHGCCGDDMIGPEAVGVKSTASAIEARAKRLFGGAP